MNNAIARLKIWLVLTKYLDGWTDELLFESTVVT